MHVILSIFFMYSWLSYFPFGFYARLAISCTEFSTVAGPSSNNDIMTLKSHCSRIYIFPWFSCANEHSNRDAPSIVSLSESFNRGMMFLIYPFSTIFYFPY